jgi:hypothetical protein
MDIKKLLNVIIFTILTGSALLAVWSQNWSNLFVIVLTLALSLVPLYLHKKFQIRISSKLRLGIVAFLFATLFLGEVNHFYETYYWWDAALHFSAGLGLTIFGFVLLKEVYAKSELRSTPAATSFFALSFTAMAAVVWEIYEFIVDMFNFTSGAMQPSNADTMHDLIIALVAALIVSAFGYRYLKFNEKNVAGKIIDDTMTVSQKS